MENIVELVREILSNEDTGHDIEHTNRVAKLALCFAKKEEANEYITYLIAMLHDVDDYKLFGKEQAKELTNAKKILNKLNVEEEIKKQVLSEIKCIGYNKRLNNIVPKTKEGQIVSDADMCDALGAHGILRTYLYGIKHNEPFFDANVFPNENLDEKIYTSVRSDATGIGHMFEKLLKLKNMMFTEEGKKEARARQKIVVDFLKHFFIEENATEWLLYLDDFLMKN